MRENCQFDDHAYHGYGIQNVLAVEPRVGSKPELAESELRSLVDEAHRLRIYVIVDIVLHHAGDVFEYVIGGQEQAEAAWQDQPKFTVRWRDEHGVGNPQWTQASATPPLDAAVFPDELRRDVLFTQRGNALSNGFHPNGDFNSLKGLIPMLRTMGYSEPTVPSFAPINTSSPSSMWMGFASIR